jgi:phosphate transport system permease protein
MHANDVPANPASSGQRALSSQPRRTKSFGKRESFEIFVPLIVAIFLTALLFRFTPLDGGFGFALVSLAIFLPSYYVSVRKTRGAKHGVDRVVAVGISIAAMITATPLVLIVYTVVRKGLPGTSLNIIAKTMEGIDPSAGPTSGGAFHAIVGTLTQVGLATVLSVPFAVATAVYLNEIKGSFTAVVRLLVDAMSGIPSIVAGLFIYSVWVIGPGHGFSGFSASLALAILMLPTVARTTEEMLRLVDPALREASLALGSSQWRTVGQVVLPTARTGIVTAVILGIARVAGETAPLLMTSFGSDGVVTPWRALSNPQSALPLFIFQQFAQDQRERAWAAALVLITLVLILFALARIIGRDRTRKVK